MVGFILPPPIRSIPPLLPPFKSLRRSRKPSYSELVVSETLIEYFSEVQDGEEAAQQGSNVLNETEWATEWGGAKSKEIRTPFKRLPFYCCALTFTPFEVAVCTRDDSVFDIMHIVPYIRKYGKHPVTGAPLKQVFGRRCAVAKKLIDIQN